MLGNMGAVKPGFSPTEHTAMANLQAAFEQAVADSKKLPEKPDNMTLLKLYALYKQATEGDVEGKRPGFTDMVGRAKYDAWAAVKGTGKDAAMQDYVDLIEGLK
jgi:diazepam-binding inhibitor (GABA receptor modulator, acyl-CoA-binding protein)